jgi:apolipoprotein D and lipocalin family protein
MKTKRKLTLKLMVAFTIVLSMSMTGGCASNEPPLPTPEHVDLERFMGRWYVVGYTPIVVDKEAHNAIEHYRLDADAKIHTTYQFREGGFDGELKTYTPVGWVHDAASNAEWRMQFLWPFRAEYIILHVDEDYSETIIAHPSRKYAWVMLRKPDVTDAEYAGLVDKLVAVGYDRDLLQRLPQDWSGEEVRLKELQAEGL